MAYGPSPDDFHYLWDDKDRTIEKMITFCLIEWWLALPMRRR
jgi:hypothetical protein